MEQEERNVAENELNTEQNKVDESVNIIREISESQKVEADRSTPEERSLGDGLFHGLLVGGLEVVGVIMVLIATIDRSHSELFVGGALFALFGLFLEFLSRNIKKD